jgi:hypothetical protein
MSETLFTVTIIDDHFPDATYDVVQQPYFDDRNIRGFDLVGYFAKAVDENNDYIIVWEADETVEADDIDWDNPTRIFLA